MAVTSTEPINTVVERGAHNRHTITVEIGKLKHSLDFKSGGSLTSGTTYTAQPNGSLSAEGLYAAWTCEGTVSVSPGMYRILLEMHKQSGAMGARGATHTTHMFNVGERFTAKHVFKNVVVAKIPALSIPEHGGMTDITVTFSLNDLKAVE